MTESESQLTMTMAEDISSPPPFELSYQLPSQVNVRLGARPSGELLSIDVIPRQRVLGDKGEDPFASNFFTRTNIPKSFVIVLDWDVLRAPTDDGVSAYLFDIAALCGIDGETMIICFAFGDAGDRQTLNIWVQAEKQDSLVKSHLRRFGRVEWNGDIGDNHIMFLDYVKSDGWDSITGLMD